MGLSVFRHVGAPALAWGEQGPSHQRYRVACTDAAECLRRRAGQGPPAVNEGVRGRPRNTPDSTPRRSTEDRRKLRALRGPVPKSKARARELREGKDTRPVCPRHGPRNTMIHEGAVRFVCCGRAVPGMKPEPKPWWQR